MTRRQPEQTEHREKIAAPPDVVYGLIADVTRWPVIFPPSVHVEYVERRPLSEVIRIWATANDTVKTWTSRRRLDPGQRYVTFRQEVSQDPVAEMGGAWIIESDGSGGSLVRLTHEYRAVDDDPGALEWIAQAVDRNSGAELGALRAAAEEQAAWSETSFTFDDTVEAEGSAQDVYDFLNEAQHWRTRLPHVARVELTETSPGLQILEMDTRTADGSSHTTRSVRVCFPGERIVYKQLRTPALMSAHTGQWRITADGGGVMITSTHTVVLNPATVMPVLGEGTTLADARAFVRRALGQNSTVTMRAAKEYAEGRRLASA